MGQGPQRVEVEIFRSDQIRLMLERAAAAVEASEVKSIPYVFLMRLVLMNNQLILKHSLCLTMRIDVAKFR